MVPYDVIALRSAMLTIVQREKEAARQALTRVKELEQTVKSAPFGPLTVLCNNVYLFSDVNVGNYKIIPGKNPQQKCSCFLCRDKTDDDNN